MRTWGWVVALTLVGGGAALAKTGDTAGEMSAVGDQGFVAKAAEGGMAEVKLAKLAMEKGQSMEVKQFARRMVEDHTKANTELGQIAEKKSLTVPTALDAEHQATYARLAKLDGAAFDQEYMRVMTDDHDKTVALFKQEAQSGRDPELKSFAMKTLPVLEKHDDLAHSDDQKMEKLPPR